jgi:hypothetical protein
MKPFFILLLACLASTSSIGQATLIRSYDLPGDATITAVASVPDGGMIVAGHTDSLGLLYRFNAIGNLIWSRKFGGGDDSMSGATFIDHQIIFRDVVTVPDGFVVAGISVVEYSEGGSQYFTMKVTLSGNVVWMQYTGNLWSQQFDAIEVSTDPSFVIVGGLTLSLAGQNALMLKIDHSDGEVVAGGSSHVTAGTNYGGSIARLDVDENGLLTAVGHDMLIRYDQGLQPVWGISGGFFYDPKGLAVNIDGSGMALTAESIIAFSPSGEIQFIKEFPGSFGSGSAMIKTANEDLLIAGQRVDGTFWLSGINELAEVLWTSDLGDPGAWNELHDMTQLTNGSIAMVATTGPPLKLQLIISDVNGAGSCAEPGDSPLLLSVPPPATDTVYFGQTGFGSSFHEALVPTTSNVLFQNYFECSSGINNVGGSVYLDENENGDHDVSEPVLPGRMVQLLPDNIFTWSDLSGYIFIVGQYGAYQIVHDPGPFWSLSEGANGYSFQFTENDTSFTDLDLGYVPLVDTTVVVVSIAGGQLSCNSITQQFLTIQNLGTTAPDVVVALEFDPMLNYQSAQPEPDSIVGGNTIYWHINSLPYLSDEVISIQFLSPGQGSMGDTLDLSANIYENVDGMGLQQITSKTSSTVVTCAYDPNYKHVDPPGEGSAGGISAETEWLTYTVHFQNTGTDTAINVMILDQLSANVHPSSIEILGHSHEMTGFSISSGGSMEFHFDGIMLPDSGADQLGSQGFIQYKVQMLTDLPVGTQIINDAGIFFDQHPPVITNTVINTIRDCTVEQPDLTIEYDGFFLLANSPDIFPYDMEYTYTWYLDGVMLDAPPIWVITPMDEGVYTVQATDDVGCVIVSAPFSYIEMQLGELHNDGIKIHPNPFVTGTWVEFGMPLTQDAIIAIHDLQGRKVRSAIGDGSSRFYLERGELDAGVYIMMVRISDRMFSARVVAQ